MASPRKWWGRCRATPPEDNRNASGPLCQKSIRQSTGSYKASSYGNHWKCIISLFIHLRLLFFIPLGSEMLSRAKQACISGVCKAEGKCFVALFSESEEPSIQEDHQIRRVDLRIYSGETGFQKVWLPITKEKQLCIYTGEINLFVKELLSSRIQ